MLEQQHASIQRLVHGGPAREQPVTMHTNPMPGLGGRGSRVRLT